jgi:hypothetical protein
MIISRMINTTHATWNMLTLLSECHALRTSDRKTRLNGPGFRIIYKSSEWTKVDPSRTE